MTSGDEREVLAILGGTGPQGRGLAVRWADAGHQVVLGSRSTESAEEAVADVAGRVDEEAAARVSGAVNLEAAARGDIVVVALPYEGQASTLPELADACASKLVVNVVNPMAFDDRGPVAVSVGAGSAAEECAELLPDSTVVSALHSVSSQRLLRLDEEIRSHALVCGDDPDARHRVVHLASRIRGMIGVECGLLRNSRTLEDLTPILIAINRTYGIHAGIRIDGLPLDDSILHPDR